MKRNEEAMQKFCNKIKERNEEIREWNAKVEKKPLLKLEITLRIPEEYMDEYCKDKFVNVLDHMSISILADSGKYTEEELKHMSDVKDMLMTALMESYIIPSL